MGGLVFFGMGVAFAGLAWLGAGVMGLLRAGAGVASLDLGRLGRSSMTF